MRIFIGLVILVSLALFASSERFYGLRRTRIGAALTTGGWLMVGIGFAIGPHGMRLILPEQLLAVAPLIYFCLGWVGLMVGLQAHRSLPRVVPGRVFGLVVLDAAFSLLIIAASAELVMLSFGVDAWTAMPMALLIGIFGMGWSPEVKSLQRGLGDAEKVMPVVRAGAGLASMLALVLYGVLYTAFDFNPSAGEAMWSASRMFGGVGMSVLIGLAMGLLGKGLMTIAQRTEGEFLVVLLGLVSFTAGAATTLGCSPLLTAGVTGAVVVNLPGKTLERFQRVIVDAEQPVAMLLMLVAGVLADAAIGIMGVALVLLGLIARGGVKWIDRMHVRRSMNLTRTPPGMMSIARQSPLALALAVGYRMSLQAEAPAAPLGGAQLLMIVIVMGLVAEAMAIVHHESVQTAAAKESEPR